MEKCHAQHQDPYLALLDYRNTPIDGVSPAQALMSRRLRSALPIVQHKLAPSVINGAQFYTNRQRQQQHQKRYYDKTARSLSPLQKGEIARFKLDPNSKWTKGKVVQPHVTPRSYIIETKDGTQYRRNRRHLRQSNEPPFDTTEIENLMPSNKASHGQTRENNHPRATREEPFKRSRYGRLINQNPNYKT